LFRQFKTHVKLPAALWAQPVRSTDHTLQTEGTLMAEPRIAPLVRAVLLQACAGVAALLAVERDTVADLSEIDSFQRAVSTQSTSDAIEFIKNFGSSHLVPDLIELLEPSVAREVCSDVLEESSRAKAPCEKVVKIRFEAAERTDAPISREVAPTGSTTSSPRRAPEFRPTTGKSMARHQAIQAPNINSASVPAKSGAEVVMPNLSSKTVTAGAESLQMPYESELLRRLVTRFAAPPFRVEHVDPRQPVVIITYVGGLSRYVMCGIAIGAPSRNSSARLSSRLVVRLAGGTSRSGRLSVDATHIVSLRGRAAGSLDVLDVYPDKPARARNGEYCWSTGELERLVGMQ
jgi:hypothetical protein